MTLQSLLTFVLHQTGGTNSICDTKFSKQKNKIGFEAFLSDDFQSLTPISIISKKKIISSWHCRRERLPNYKILYFYSSLVIAYECQFRLKLGKKVSKKKELSEVQTKLICWILLYSKSNQIWNKKVLNAFSSQWRTHENISLRKYIYREMFQNIWEFEISFLYKK